MNHTDKTEFARVLNGLAAFYRVDLTKEAYQMWWAAMQDWSIDSFRDAAGYLAKSCEFMPKPYDFEQLRKAGQISTHEAWATALEHAKGAYRYGKTDPMIERTVRAMGGWQSIAMCPTEKLPFEQRRFMECYENMRDSNEVRERLPEIAAPNVRMIGHG